MTQRPVRFWTIYTAVMLLLSAGVAYAIFQGMELKDRADQAEEAVEFLTERPPRMPEAWTFRIDDDVVLRCSRADADEQVYVCHREEP